MFTLGIIALIGYTIVVFCLGFIMGFIVKKHLKKWYSDKKKGDKGENEVIGAKTKYKSSVISNSTHQQLSVVNASDVPQLDCKSPKEFVTTREPKPSPKELKKIKRQQDRANKKEENQKCLEQGALEQKRKAFNPKKSKPENVSYQYLAVSDGRLVPCAVGQTPYYHYWEYEGKFYYEFFCDPSKVAKAVNNRSVIIDPFCQKDSDSVNVDKSKSMKIVEFGELDENINIITKSIISYR
jgi:hypothetical protein